MPRNKNKINICLKRQVGGGGGGEHALHSSSSGKEQVVLLRPRQWISDPINCL
jgi:hypothetical protein